MDFKALYRLLLSCTGGELAGCLRWRFTLSRSSQAALTWLPDRQRLRAGCHVVSGTPGRVWDLLHAGILSVKAVTLLVLDEADEMLQRNFLDQIQCVAQRLPAGQVILVRNTGK